MKLKLGAGQSNAANFCKSKLLSEEIYPHPVCDLQLIETHISCVILTGDYAYKVKKNVDMGFVDYSSLEKRKRFCEMEVQLNRRFAPELYLGVVPIFNTSSGVVVGPLEAGQSRSHDADLQIVDYAVKMKQFPAEAMVVERLEGNAIDGPVIEKFGQDVARFHETLGGAHKDSEFGQPQQIVADAIDNFEVLHKSLDDAKRGALLRRLERWTRETGDQLAVRMAARFNEGKVRRCHGDLHLKNIIQMDGRLVPFDGIEFNEAFQWVDVLSEIAFPVMDFWARGRGDLGWRLLNAYLEASGDYADLSLLRFYLVYRALVRAKVSSLNPGNHTEARRAQYANEDDPNDPLSGPWDKHLRAAEHFAFEMQPALTIMHGFSGSGKSTIAMDMVAREGGIRIRSDVERIRLHREHSTLSKYAAETSNLVYQRLQKLASSCIKAGIPVIIDAAFLNHARRWPFHELAQEHAVPFRIIDCQAPVAELRARLQKRKNDPSDADVDVLETQIENHDPLTEEELKFVSHGG